MLADTLSEFEGVRKVPLGKTNECPDTRVEGFGSILFHGQQEWRARARALCSQLASTGKEKCGDAGISSFTHGDEQQVPGRVE